jgi:uncharacterized delta-60 repeat protein
MSKVKYHYTATISQISPEKTGFTGGTLIVGQTYKINSYQEPDDFSNIANVIPGNFTETHGQINSNNCYFIATGTTPLRWTNGSSLVTFGNPWTNFLDTNLDGTTWGYTEENRYYLKTNKLVDKVKTNVNISSRDDIENNGETITSSYWLSDNFNINTNFNCGVDNDPNGFTDKHSARVQDIIPFKEVYQGEVVEGIIVGGIFDTYLNDDCFGLVKLKLDGSVFSKFNGGIDYTGDGLIEEPKEPYQVKSLKLQRDGKLLVGGIIGSYKRTDILSCLIRINTDGNLDTTFYFRGFDVANNDVVNTIAIQNDGKILVGGHFIRYTYVNSSYTSKSIVRLNSNGTVDTTFNSQRLGFDGDVNIIVIQQDGKILVGGQFTQYNDVTCNYLVRLNSNGSVDDEFTANYGNFLDGQVTKIVIESDGCILVGGDFTDYLIRFNSDGTRNNKFAPFSNINNTVHSLFVQSDNRILVGFLNGTTTIRRFDKYCVMEDFTINSDGYIGTILEKDGMVYLGGDFSRITAAGEYSSNCIFSLDSTTRFNLRTSKENFNNLSLDIKIYD